MVSTQGLYRISPPLFHGNVPMMCLVSAWRSRGCRGGQAHDAETAEEDMIKQEGRSREIADMYKALIMVGFRKVGHS